MFLFEEHAQSIYK